MDKNVADEGIVRSKRFDEETGLDNPARKDAIESSRTEESFDAETVPGIYGR